jgi:hypothetical protein
MASSGETLKDNQITVITKGVLSIDKECLTNKKIVPSETRRVRDSDRRAFSIALDR